MYDSLKIVELAMYLPLPYAGAYFAGMGAEVVKVERPGGDPLGELDAGAYAALNEGKSVRRHDLRDPAGREAVRTLLGDADIVLDGFRRGFLKKNGLGYDDLRESNPGCIFISLAAYDDNLSLAGKAGHDLNFLALSGILSPSGRLSLPLPFQIADMAGALWAIVGAYHMLERRRQSGVGGELDLSLFRAGLSVFPFSHFAEKGGLLDGGLLSGRFACYNSYVCRDGRWIAVGSLEEKFFRRLLEILCIEFDGGIYDPGAQPALIDIIAQAFAARDGSWWAERLENEDICVTPVLTRDEAQAMLEKDGIAGTALRRFLLSPLS